MCTVGTLIFAISSPFGGDLQACAQAFTCDSKQEIEIAEFEPDRGTTAWSSCPLEYGITRIETSGASTSMIETEISPCFHRDMIRWVLRMEFEGSVEECKHVVLSFEPKST